VKNPPHRHHPLVSHIRWCFCNSSRRAECASRLARECTWEKSLVVGEFILFSKQGHGGIEKDILRVGKPTVPIFFEKRKY